MTSVAIMQPTYMPWLGYFAMIASVDVFVILDDVQLMRGSWHVRNRIAGQNGREPTLLTIPVRRDARYDQQRICDATVADAHDWRRAHLRSLRSRYARAPFGAFACNFWEEVLATSSQNLADITINGIITACRVLDITTPLLRASAYPQASAKRRSNRLADLVHMLGGSVYLTPPGALDYLKEDRATELFACAGAQIAVFGYEHPEYRQDGAFQSHLGIIDLIAFHGPGEAAGILTSGIRTPTPLVGPDHPLKEA